MTDPTPSNLNQPPRPSNGKLQTKDDLLVLVYDDLRKYAAGLMKFEKPGHTLQATALAHDAIAELLAEPGRPWNDAAHLCNAVRTVMRRRLIDYSRAKKALKRGGDAKREGLESIAAPVEQDSLDIERLYMSLDELAIIAPRQAEVAELRYLASLETATVGQLLGISKRTVELDWGLAKAWLKEALGDRVFFD